MKKLPNTIDAPESDYLYLETSQIINAGKGLYTAIDIYKDEIISLFKGKILTENEAKKRAAIGHDNYFMNMIDGTILDAMHTECFAKYANDAAAFSQLTFRNNAKITLDDNNNVCLIAIKKIQSGEEIFCSYGSKYWKKRLELKTH